MLPGLALIVGVVGVYLPCLNGPLLWDDHEWFEGINAHCRGLAGLWRIWTQPESLQQYYPVTATSFWIDHHWWDARTLPAHLENVLWHGANAVLFWQLLKRLGLRGSWFAAALFAAHPVMVESVAWITERKNVLATFFSLAALLVHGSGSRWWPSALTAKPKTAAMAALVLFGLALLAKISAAALPGVVIVIGWWRFGRVRWRADALRVLPWCAAVVPLFWLTSRLEHMQVTGGDVMPSLELGQRWLLASQLPWFYLSQLAWPHGLCVLYEKWPLHPSVWWQWSGAVGLGLLFAVILQRRWRGVAALTLVFLGTLFPVLGFFDINGMKYAWAADRWNYLPAMAVFVGAAEALARLRRDHARHAIAALVLLICGWFCLMQSNLYADADRFWQAAIQGNRSPWKARNDYSSHLISQKRFDEARQQLEAALQIRPAYVAAHVNLAAAFTGLGRNADALGHLDQALALQPAPNAVPHFNKAVILRGLNRGAEAEAELRAAIVDDPKFFAAHNDLGNLLLLTGRYDEAMACFQALLNLRPGNAGALTSIGNIHFMRGEAAQALASFEEALRSEPNLASTLANMAWIRASSADDNLRDGSAAVRDALRAADLTGRADPSVLQILAAAYAEDGDFDAAISVCGEAEALARSQGRESLAASVMAMRQRFETKLPYRMPRR